MHTQILLSIATLNTGSPQAARITTLTDYFFVGAAFIMLLVTGLLIWIVIKFGKKNASGKNIKHARLLETLMIGVPLLMIGYFFVLTLKAMNFILPQSLNERTPDVIITAHQWWWEAQYPKAHVTAANEIHLPVHQNIVIQFHSDDVVHSWWVPKLGNKMDIIPGINNNIQLQINNVGKYAGTCSEFCGEQHARMRIHVIAEDKQKFATWLTQQKLAARVPDSIAALGAKIFQHYTCGNCHTIKGTEAGGNTGPDLTHIASRSTILAGMLPNNTDNLKRWLQAPQKIKPGAYMPDFLFNNDSLNALVFYMNSLK